MEKKQGCPSTASAADFLPAKLELPLLAKAAAKCQGCELYCNATQTVFGEGPADAIIMFVGEQPGDQEERAGKPFVGPAGRILNEGMQQAAIPREQVYVTNAVKHFKWEPRGTRRLHSKPSSREVAACRPWLEAEIAAIEPQIIVCLGATAAQSLLGNAFRITKERGKIIENTAWAPCVIATVHPSSILRIPDHDARAKAREDLFSDLRVAAQRLRHEKHSAATRAKARADLDALQHAAKPIHAQVQKPHSRVGTRR
jgi:uracil-DNA glycosylase